MGLFNRKQKEEVQRDNTQPAENQNNGIAYSQPGKTFNLDLWGTDPENISTFFGGVELISNSIAGIPIKVKDLETLEEIKNHPITNAIKYGKMTKFNFIKQLIHDIYIKGNGVAYIKRDGNAEVKELIYCPPGSYTIYVDARNQRVPYYIIRDENGDFKTVDASQVIHIFKNSKDGIIGLGIDKYARITVPLSSAADKSALEFYDSGGNINGILQSTRHLDTEDKMEAYNEWTNAFRGGNKNGNIAVLGNDFEYKTVGISQKDAQQLETREFNVLEICRYLNINPVLLGIKTGSTYNNIEQAQLDLVIHTLLPLIELIEEEFNRKLIRPSQRGNIIIDFDEDKIMFSDKMSTANYLTTLTKNGIISINDARKSLGYTEKEGADKLMIPFTNVNDNTIGKDNNEKEDKNTDNENE